MDKIFSATTDKAAFEKLLEEAQKGNPDAQYQIGRMYIAGRYFSDLVVPQDRMKGLRYVRHAAKQGHILATDYLEEYETVVRQPVPTEPQPIAAFLTNHLLGIFLLSAAASVVAAYIYEYLHNAGADREAVAFLSRSLGSLIDWVRAQMP